MYTSIPVISSRVVAVRLGEEKPDEKQVPYP
jgi:hypothetical protein